eukprot:CAMPEP_0116891536 /NCGR_PEP_ID=MMETSP0467-20121206/1923_1 /TAXON_ID=283647 /ORGANISM="Mesodinium pulex, Strain SPMC105" /LENGTH=82 /DNA_ID=CAMNT_0004560091 /DNA_START=190 /DNA_END=438 /DNA_ORIENTATION=+
MPNVGYKSPKATRFMDRVTGLKQFRVFTVKELELLLVHGKEFTVVVDHKIGAEKRVAILKRAKELNLNVYNENSKVKKQDKE